MHEKNRRQKRGHELHLRHKEIGLCTAHTLELADRMYMSTVCTHMQGSVGDLTRRKIDERNIWTNTHFSVSNDRENPRIGSLKCQTARTHSKLLTIQVQVSTS